jgi:hypothetical protein
MTDSTLLRQLEGFSLTTAEILACPTIRGCCKATSGRNMIWRRAFRSSPTSSASGPPISTGRCTACGWRIVGRSPRKSSTSCRASCGCNKLYSGPSLSVELHGLCGLALQLVPTQIARSRPPSTSRVRTRRSACAPRRSRSRGIGGFALSLLVAWLQGICRQRQDSSEIQAS